MGAHSIQTDPTNRFAFVPHIANRGPNAIYQFRFDPDSGTPVSQHAADGAGLLNTWGPGISASIPASIACIFPMSRAAA